VTHKGGGIASGPVPLGGNIVATWPATETPTANQLQLPANNSNSTELACCKTKTKKNLAKCKFLPCLSLFTIRKP